MAEDMTKDTGFSLVKSPNIIPEKGFNGFHWRNNAIHLYVGSLFLYTVVVLQFDLKVFGHCHVLLDCIALTL